MNYYIGAKPVKKRKTVKVVLYILAYLLVFALSFFISFKLVASTRTDTEEIEALKAQVSSLEQQIKSKDETISSLELQITNINNEIARKEADEAAALAAAEAEGENGVDMPNGGTVAPTAADN